MADNVLNSIIQLTGQKDVDSLEYCLLAALNDLLPCFRLSLFKLSLLQNTFHIEETISLCFDKDDSNKETPVWSEQTPATHIPDVHDLACSDHRHAESGVDGQVSTTFQIRIEQDVVCLLQLLSHRSIEHHTHLVNGILSVYENYLTVLKDSERDKLTGLFNRRTFDWKLSKLIEKQGLIIEQQRDAGETLRAEYQASVPWMAVVDIDWFKRINDQFGHVCGDEVLLLLAQKMQENFRKTDLLFRFGGEEFVIVLEPVPFDVASLVLERFRKVIEDFEFPMAGQVTISAGFAGMHEGQFPRTILELADKALYYAKENGRNQVCNYEALAEKGFLSDTKDSGDIELF